MEKKEFKNILMIKSYSAGIGDILRSSAAWRALKNKYNNVSLSLLFITNHPTYPSLELISKHHLLDKFFPIYKRELKNFKNLENTKNFLDSIVKQVRPDLIIDFEPYGMTTTLVALYFRIIHKIPTLGINEVFPRGYFYTYSADSIKKFAKKTEKKLPLNFTDKDFVVLYRLGIERGNIEIEIQETEEGKKFRKNIRNILKIKENLPLFGINIGCGTEDAKHKRPDFRLLAKIVKYVYNKYKMIPILFGAPFEKQINQSFINQFFKYNIDIPIYDLAGKTNIFQLVGAINAMELFISSDSGPYHIATALKKPNVAIFNFPNEEHYNINPWTKCVVAPNEKYFNDVAIAIDEVLSENKSFNVS